MENRKCDKCGVEIPNVESTLYVEDTPEGKVVKAMCPACLARDNLEASARNLPGLICKYARSETQVYVLKGYEAGAIIIPVLGYEKDGNFYPKYGANMYLPPDSWFRTVAQAEFAYRRGLDLRIKEINETINELSERVEEFTQLKNRKLQVRGEDAN